MKDQIKQSQTWWHKNKQTLIIAIVIILVLLFTFALIVYRFGWDWTGFTSVAGPTVHPNEQYRPAKTLWDVLQLLIVPIILTIGGFWLNQIQKSREEETAKKRSEDERKRTSDNQREVALQAYIDNISELLLKEHLCESEPDAEVRNIARARTLTVLRRLDEKRKGSLIQFLHESNLINKYVQNGIIRLREADLSYADLYRANLWGVDLSQTHLFRANLSEADLQEADLNGVNLQEAHLEGTVLKRTHLDWAYLQNADLSWANLFKAHLSQANLSGANLKDTNLQEADLTGAKVTDNQLAQAKSLKGATMPDGSIPP